MIDTITVVFSLGLLLSMLLLVMHTVERIPALSPWRLVMLAIAMAWWAVPFAKKAYVDDIFYPNDSILHEETAREVAYLMRQGDWSGALDLFGFGNEGYRFVLGCFYALTDAPEVITYGIHGLLSFWGMLTILEIVCMQSNARRVPLWIVMLILANPSAMFWTTFNLKEGAMLWGICMLLRAAMRFGEVPTREGGFWSATGLIVSGFLRPHIVMAYLAALAIGVAVRQRKVGLALVAIAGLATAVLMLKTMAPVIYDQLAHNGIDATLNEKFNELNSDGGSAITYARGEPIPLISGFLLICLRPFPWEVSDITTIAAGGEIWLITAVAIFGWYSLQRRSQLLTTSYVLTLIVAVVAISFYFTYMYNMGLMVRQRVMAFPALLSLAVLPTLVRLNRTRPVTQPLSTPIPPSVRSAAKAMPICASYAATAPKRHVRPARTASGPTSPPKSAGSNLTRDKPTVHKPTVHKGRLLETIPHATLS